MLDFLRYLGSFSDTSEARAWRMVLTLELTPRLAGSRSRSTEYVLVLFYCDVLFETHHFGRVQTASKLSNKGQRLSVVSLMAQYVLKYLC